MCPSVAPQDVARWLSAADLRRARCVCQQWRGALSALATTAQVQLLAGTLVHWKQQLGALVRALPFMAVLEVQGRLSDVAAAQLTQLERAKHLRALKILSGQDLRDKSLQVGPAARNTNCTMYHLSRHLSMVVGFWRQGVGSMAAHTDPSAAAQMASCHPVLLPYTLHANHVLLMKAAPGSTTHPQYTLAWLMLFALALI
jgi:hypothetical protein